jgi:hypothetical protein
MKMDSVELESFDENVYLFTVLGSPSAEACEKGLIAPLNVLLQRNIPFSLIVNGKDISGVSIAATWKIVSWMRANREAIKENLRSTSVFLTLPAVRKAIEFVFSIQPPMRPVGFFNNLDACWEFVYSNKQN